MDNSTEKSDKVAELEERKKVIEKWLVHPVTQAILEDAEQQQKAFLDVILEQPIVTMESFFLHFTACGHLRGIRRFKVLAEDRLEEIEEELKEETKE